MTCSRSLSVQACVLTLAMGASAALAEEPAPSATLPAIGVDGQVEGMARPVATSKTGTALEDLPIAVQVVSKALAEQQGATGLKGAVLRNVSGLSEGGGSSYGFFDRFTSRGLDMNFMSDGMGDGPMTNGYNRSMTGVERIEVLKGPGSALFGSGSPGGTVNMVRAKPQKAFAFGGSETAGSFGASATTVYATGGTGLDGLLYRMDGGYSRADGFRGIGHESSEFLPTLEWRSGKDHTVTVALELRRQNQVTDSYGIPIAGTALVGISRETKLYSPFAKADQDAAKLTLSDEWTLSDLLSINSRVTMADRRLEILRNAGGTVAANSFTMTGRQLRKQNDHWQDMSAQVEPTWTFTTWGIGHTALTGVEVQRHVVSADRYTATLDNIVDIRNPVIPEATTAPTYGTHNFDSLITANYTSAYVNDQVDVTDRLKLRGGVRYDYFVTEVEQKLWQGRGERHDGKWSWQAGALYKIAPGISPFVGYSRSHLAQLSSEALGSSLGAMETNLTEPERGTQWEVGVKAESEDKRYSASLSAFDVMRENFIQISGTNVFQASQETKGIELDLSVEPILGWKTTANFTLQDAHLTNFPSDPTLVGRKPLGVPATMANLWTALDIPGLEGTRLAGGVSYKGVTYKDNNNYQHIPGYVVADMVATQQLERVELAGGVRNLFDRDYFVRNSNAGALPGEPRTFFARVAAKF